jgi:hypothetical protein
MMIAGTVNLEDVTINFLIDGDNLAHVAVSQLEPSGGVTHDAYVVDGAKFMKALAIAVHFDGTPDFNKDYADAESAMGETIRWIP